MSNQIPLPKLKPGVKFVTCLGLVLVMLYSWFNAIIIALVLIALLPALLNTLLILPVRTIGMFLLYLGSVVAWAALGGVLLAAMLCIQKNRPVPSRYLTICSVALIFLTLCQLVFNSHLIALLQ